MRACLFFLAVFVSALPLVAQAKHPFTFEDMMALKRVEEPEVSPDGKWVLFAAVDVDLQANTKTPHVWVVPLQATAGPSTPLGMTESREGKEKEIISDQDADRPRWAPDGKRFAFVSTKEDGSQIWVADFDGATGTVTGRHRLTNMPTEASGELWSPDGKNILFESDVYPECEGTAQAEADCNAKTLEEKKNSKVKALIFTHLLYRHWNAYKEGKRTHLFVASLNGCVGTAASAVRPGEAGQSESRASLDRTAEGGCSHMDSAAPRDLTPGDYDGPVFSLGGQDDYAFSPDGKEICYASNHDAMPAASTNNDLFTVPVNFPGGATSKDVLAATKDITAENKAADNTPLYSPDGKYIAYRAQQRPGYESDQWRLMLHDRKTGEKKNLTGKFEGWVESFTWVSGHAKPFYHLLFTSEREGNSTIFEVYTDTPDSPPCVAVNITVGNPSRVCAWLPNSPRELGQEGGVIGGYPVDQFRLRTIPKEGAGYDDSLSTTPDGRRVLLTEMSVYAPAEIYSRDLDSSDNAPQSSRTQITHLNDETLSHIDLSRPYGSFGSFWFSGAHGDKVQGWLIKPPNFDPNKKYPVKFIVHGGPEVPMGDEWSYRWNFELFAANGYVVVFINFHGSPGYGQKFIDAINGDWGGAPFEDLMKGLDYAEQHYSFIDKDRECALGASYGGYMANWILRHTNRFKCIVTHDGMFNTESAWGDTEELWFNEWEFKGTPYTNREMYRKWSPHLSAANFKTPTLVIHSQLDYRLDVSQGFDLFTTLQREGVPSKMLYFPDEGHWVLKPQNSQLWYRTVNDWVDQWVGK
jgi:dipeptidyl aminopeptidase/acylaminoacyl peptidase